VIVTITKLTKKDAAARGTPSGWCYTIKMKDEGFQAFGYSTYRATLEALLSFAE